ncbi:MAG: hypothetical protein H6748_19725 [Spirochaetaceae bacterium]|nr:hypothetical protein [Myxococcales bacterium]MCB9726286.1 hypothetical protein [Spirochaetaceae bacterium]
MGRLAPSRAVTIVILACLMAGIGLTGGSDPVRAAAVPWSVDRPRSAWLEVTRPDPRLCPSPMCGGVFVRALNRWQLRCADGHHARECYVGQVDWSALGLDPDAEARLGGEFTARRVVVRGALFAEDLFGRSIPALRVDEAWRGVTGSRSLRDGFWLVTPSGIVCITHPCPVLNEERLNSRRSRALHEIDLASRSDASSAQVQEGLDALYSGAGLVVLGRHRRVEGPAGIGFELVAQEFYVRVAGSGGGERCGPVACGPGLECCNPLMGICVEPGQVCIQ